MAYDSPRENFGWHGGALRARVQHTPRTARLQGRARSRRVEPV